VRKDVGQIMVQRRENSWLYMSSLVKKKRKNNVKSVALHRVITNCSMIVSNGAENTIIEINCFHLALFANQSWNFIYLFFSNQYWVS